MKKTFSKILIAIAFVALSGFMGTNVHAATVTIAITSGTSFSTSTDGSPIIVEAYGAGGGGARTGNEGSAGGGGEYCKSTLSYTSGSTIPIQIGQGGPSGNNVTNGSPGTATTWNTNGVVANGGQGGSYFALPNGWNSLGGTSGIGTLCYNGGSTGTNIQAGAGSAGPNSAGGSPPNWYTPGTGGGVYAGNGGTPGTGSSAGNLYGGGGAGASGGWGSGPGANGLLVITFNQASSAPSGPVRRIRFMGITR